MMQFIDLAAQQKRIRGDVERRIQSVLEHGKYIMGPEVGELESRLAEFTGVKHAVSCASGTDALLLALMEQNVGPGDVIFTTPFTFIATAEVIQLLGAVPVFADIDPATFNIDPVQLATAAEALKKDQPERYPLPRTDLSDLEPKGIIAVDIFGLPADYDAVSEIAGENRLAVIQDAAQSFGALRGGKRAGSHADVGCTSFFPAKPLGCYGDGGAVFTDDDARAEVMKSIRIHGKGTDKYDNVRIGINGRMDTIQAAVLLSKLDIFSDEIGKRQLVASRYHDLLKNVPDLTVPEVPEGMTSVWAQYSVLAKDEASRERFRNALKKEGIPTAVYYPKPLHLQTAFSALGYEPGDFPVSEDCAGRIFSLPMHPYLSAEAQERIAEVMMKNR